MTKTKRIRHSIQMVWKRTNQQMAAWMALTMTRGSSKWNSMSKFIKWLVLSVEKKSSIKIYWIINERIRHTPYVYVNLSGVINHAMTTTDHEIEIKYRTLARIHLCVDRTHAEIILLYINDLCVRTYVRLYRRLRRALFFHSFKHTNTHNDQMLMS